jgi:paraquat-inducible protein B
MTNIHYSTEFETLLKEEAEKAESMSILHTKSYEKYQKFSIYINIPVIVFSSIIGFLSPLALFPNQGLLLGALSIGVAIMKTTDNYFDFTKRCETHRMTALNYIRISKFIQLQLSLEKECRVKPSDLFQLIQNDLQNIRDAEPLVPSEVIDKFNARYKDEPTARPAITNGLTQIRINTKRNYYDDTPKAFVLNPLASVKETVIDKLKSGVLPELKTDE